MKSFLSLIAKSAIVILMIVGAIKAIHWWESSPPTSPSQTLEEKLDKLIATLTTPKEKEPPLANPTGEGDEQQATPKNRQNDPFAPFIAVAPPGQVFLGADKGKHGVNQCEARGGQIVPDTTRPFSDEKGSGFRNKCVPRGQ